MLSTRRLFSAEPRFSTVCLIYQSLCLASDLLMQHSLRQPVADRTGADLGGAGEVGGVREVRLNPLNLTARTT